MLNAAGSDDIAVAIADVIVDERLGAIDILYSEDSNFETVYGSGSNCTRNCLTSSFNVQGTNFVYEWIIM